MADPGGSPPAGLQPEDPAPPDIPTDPELQVDYLLGMVAFLGALAAFSLAFAWLIQRFCWNGFVLPFGEWAPGRALGNSSSRRAKWTAFALLVASLSFLWYASSVSFILLNRFVMGGVKHKLSFPATLTLCHMVFKGSAAALVFWRKHYLEVRTFAATSAIQSPISGSGRRLTTAGRCFTCATWRWATVTYRINRQVMLNFIVPLGLATALDIFLSNLALRYVSMQLYTVCKSSALIWTYLMSVCLRLQRMTWLLSLAVAGVGSGVILTALQPTTVHAGGMVAVLLAAGFSASRWVVSQKYFERAGVNPSVFLLILLQTPMTVLLLLPLAMGEFSSLLEVVQGSSATGMLLLGFGLGGGMLAFFLLVVELTLINMTSALTTNVIGHLKDILAVGAAVVVLSEELTLLNAIGVGLTVVSATFYSVVKAKYGSPHSKAGSSGSIAAAATNAGMLSPGGGVGAAGGIVGGVSANNFELFRLPWTGQGTLGGAGANGFGAISMVDLGEDDDDDSAGRAARGGIDGTPFDDDDDDGTAIPVMGSPAGAGAGAVARLQFSPDATMPSAAPTATKSAVRQSGSGSGVTKRPVPRLLVTGGAGASGALRRMPFSTGVIDLDDLSSNSGSSEEGAGISRDVDVGDPEDESEHAPLHGNHNNGGSNSKPGHGNKAAAASSKFKTTPKPATRVKSYDNIPIGASTGTVGSGGSSHIGGHSLSDEQDLSSGVGIVGANNWTTTSFASPALSFSRKKGKTGGADSAEKK